jgi:integrase
VQAWANTLPASQRRTVVQHFNLLWKTARSWGYTQAASPAEFINLGAPPMPRPKFILTREQYLRLRAILPAVLADMVDVAANTGLRISEIRGLPVRCVDLAAGVIRIEQRLDHLDILDSPKSTKGRRVSPIGGLKDLFRRSMVGKQPNDFVFPGGTYENLWSVVKAAAGKAGCDAPGFGWHTFRRSFNTWLRKRGMSTSDRMDQMGHASEAVNGLYDIRDEEDFRRREEIVTELQADLMGEPKGRAN